MLMALFKASQSSHKLSEVDSFDHFCGIFAEEEEEGRRGGGKSREGKNRVGGRVKGREGGKGGEGGEGGKEGKWGGRGRWRGRERRGLRDRMGRRKWYSQEGREGGRGTAR